jgi:hypothetical protein
MPGKEYIGDSVYVECEGGMLKLTTNNGRGPSNTIYMEPATLNALVKYYDRCNAASAPINEKVD